MDTFTHQVYVVGEVLCTMVSLQDQQESTILQNGHPGFLEPCTLCLCFPSARFDSQTSLVSGSEPATVEVNASMGATALPAESLQSDPLGGGRMSQAGCSWGSKTAKGRRTGQYSRDLQGKWLLLRLPMPLLKKCMHFQVYRQSGTLESLAGSFSCWLLRWR